MDSPALWAAAAPRRARVGPRQITAPLLALPSDNCVNRNCCTSLLAFEFGQALTTVLEELVNGESGIVTDISEAQIACKLSQR